MQMLPQCGQVTNLPCRDGNQQRPADEQHHLPSAHGLKYDEELPIVIALMVGTPSPVLSAP